MTDTKVDYYAALEIERSATAEEIKKAYRRLARKYHPDVSEEPDATERFKLIQAAYEVLKDEDKRRVYDETGRDDNSAVLESQARAGLAQYVLKWIEIMQNAPMIPMGNYSTDMSAWIETQLSNEAVVAQANKAQGERTLKATQKMLKRLKYKGKGKDVVRMVLEQRVEHVQNGLRVAADNIARVALARQYVNDYELEPESSTTYSFQTLFIPFSRG